MCIRFGILQVGLIGRRDHCANSNGLGRMSAEVEDKFRGSVRTKPLRIYDDVVAMHFILFEAIVWSGESEPFIVFWIDSRSVGRLKGRLMLLQR